jgi:Tol biopolymer transport system component
VRLTSTSGLSIDPALSPDESLLAYASDRGGEGGFDIWVQPLNAETPARLTDEPGDELEPSFSPDGRWIVYAKGETGGIYIVAAAGGKPRLLVAAQRAHGPRFSPDGQSVVYWTGLPSVPISQGGLPRAAGAVFVVSTSGGPPRRVAEDLVDARNPVWSPDGQRILFLGHTSDGEADASLDWYVVDRAGGAPVRTMAVTALREADVSGIPIPADWNREGVVFVNYGNVTSNVWRLPLSMVPKPVTGKPLRLTFGTATERTPTVSTSGHVAFASVVENVDVWRVPLDPDTGTARGALERVTDNAAIDRVINLTDDGGTLAFLSSRTGRSEVWIREIQTGAEHQVSFAEARWGRISHDGSAVAIDGRTPHSGVDVVSVTGGERSNLCIDCTIADWSADDSRVLLRRGLGRLFTRARASGMEKELTAHPEWALNQARFSPDGRWVAFHTANSPSLRQIYVVPADRHEIVPVEDWVSVVSDFGMQASWSPDGTRIYHFSLRDGAFCAWMQPVDRETKRPIGAPVAVKHFHDPRLRAVTGAFATNDVAAGYIYVTLTGATANIWMLNP